MVLRFLPEFYGHFRQSFSLAKNRMDRRWLCCAQVLELVSLKFAVT